MLGTAGDIFISVFTNYDYVFDAHAELSFQINAGFDAQNVANLRDMVTERRKSGVFVYL